jgi:hypothetical protein
VISAAIRVMLARTKALYAGDHRLGLAVWTGSDQLHDSSAGKTVPLTIVRPVKRGHHELPAFSLQTIRIPFPVSIDISLRIQGIWHYFVKAIPLSRWSM